MPFWNKHRASFEQVFNIPPERVIAFARLTLTLIALLGSLLDPPHSSYDARVTYLIAIGYLAFAILGFCLVVTRPPRRWEQFVAHTVDISCVCLLMRFNDGPNSPYFVFFTFILLSAALRWGWRGAIDTTVLLVLIFFAFILLISRQPFPIEIGELSRSIFRPAYLVVAGIMLAYVSALKERGRQQLAKLASWPGPDYEQDLQIPIKSALAHAAQIMRVPRVLIVWELYEEPFRDVALWSHDGFEYSREPPDRFGSFVATPLNRRTFGVPSGGGTVDRLSTKRMFAGEMIDRDLRETFSIQRTVTAPFFLQICHGRVFLLDREASDESDLLLAELVATRIGIDLEHHWLRNQLQEAAGTRERERLARDLHDGVLQGLAAANIHLSLSSDHADGCMGQRLAQTRRLLSEEQQRIRNFVESSRIHKGVQSERVNFAPEADKLLTHLGSLWECQIHVTVEPPDLQIGMELMRHIRHLLAEAVSNAVRHGKASEITVIAKATSDRLDLIIADNGLGFPDLYGSYSGEELSERNIGPFSIRTRATEMGGGLTLQTSSSGAEIQIEVPL